MQISLNYSRFTEIIVVQISLRVTRSFLILIIFDLTDASLGRSVARSIRARFYERIMKRQLKQSFELTWTSPLLHNVFTNGPNPASFCFFSFFSHDKYITNLTINDKSVDGVLRTRTRGGGMVGTDEFTVLWRHPNHPPQCHLFVFQNVIQDFNHYKCNYI